MTNPFLQDTVERVGRDPRRKLAWDDRLVGTMRLALHQDIVPRRYALGAAAALAALDPLFLREEVPARSRLAPIWGDGPIETEEAVQVLRLIEEAKRSLTKWSESGFKQLIV